MVVKSGMQDSSNFQMYSIGVDGEVNKVSLKVEKQTKMKKKSSRQKEIIIEIMQENFQNWRTCVSRMRGSKKCPIQRIRNCHKKVHHCEISEYQKRS